MKTKWRELIKVEAEANGDNFEDLIFNIYDGRLDPEFDASRGEIEGAVFVAWSEKFVYFPVSHDGAEWVGHVPRHPQSVKKPHQGGG